LIKIAIPKNIAATIDSIINRGKANLNHFSKGTTAIPNIAINTPFVGIIIF